MRLTIVGCSGSLPGPGGAASSYLLEAPDADGRTWRVVLDLGSGAVGPLQSHVSLLELDAVVISHLHPDHFLDLCGLYVARAYAPTPADRALPVYGPEGLGERLVQAYGPDAVEGMPRIYDTRPLRDGEPFAVGPFTITPRLVEHPVVAYGLRVEAGEVSLAYSGDTDLCPNLTELARGCDAFLCEASFEEERDSVRGIHLTGRRAGEAATAAAVARLLLTHVPVWTDRAVVMREARQTYAGPAELVEPGRSYDIGPRRTG